MPPSPVSSATALPHAPVDELTARRTARRSRVLGIVGVAAAVAVVLGVVAVATRDSGDKTQVASTQERGVPHRHDGHGRRRGFDRSGSRRGLRSDRAARPRERARSRSDAESAAATDDRAADSASEAPSADASKSAERCCALVDGCPLAGVLPATPSPVTLSADCLAAQAQAFAISSEPLFTAAATFHGQPATVVVYAQPLGRQVLVVSPDGCTLLLSQLLT